MTRTTDTTQRNNDNNNDNNNEKMIKQVHNIDINNCKNN